VQIHIIPETVPTMVFHETISRSSNNSNKACKSATLPNF
jgi:hypothetical protein